MSNTQQSRKFVATLEQLLNDPLLKALHLMGATEADVIEQLLQRNNELQRGYTDLLQQMTVYRVIPATDK